VADPVSWKVMEPGWHVFDAEGDEVGKVGEITGDVDADIFDGLTLSTGAHSHARYVPAESVAEIRDHEVHLSLTRDGVEALEKFTEPAPQEQIIPEKSRWYQRLAWWTTGRNR
jgi:hypothetical protein